MLSSSDAKARCLWQMLIWSLVLCFVSQYSNIKRHLAFYLFAFVSIIILPILTAFYSNSSGRKGAGLLRAGYVLTDPILACLALTPVVVLNDLPDVVVRLHNLSDIVRFNATDVSNMDSRYKLMLIQATVLLPIILLFAMGRRTRKMELSTFLLDFSYWLVVEVEICTLIEQTYAYSDAVLTTCSIVAIASILTNTYAIVTLCSYLTPTTKDTYETFDILFKGVNAFSAVCFVEVPLIVCRVRLLMANGTMNGSFYGWFLKDGFTITVILVVIIDSDIIKRKFSDCYTCRTNHFEPEKRDVYIRRKINDTYKDIENIERAQELTKTIYLNSADKLEDETKKEVNKSTKKKVSFKL
ncbi:unnamed protein product [Dimorphilus gyrociliatus]|uniref:Uncharacterized protein n=1 Tax=Dimorphilus gyrociliatus TaxID=2664684 RepID=A0A7I8VKW8_9ANNE|nr:unnamed protein product [Dimorphilus gyrociliatus]